jgi:sugar phosphate isomerase/epimerase
MTCGNIGMVVSRASSLCRLERFGLRRAEFVLMEADTQEIVKNFVSERNMKFSAHCPFFAEDNPPTRAGLLASIVDSDEDRRMKSLALMERTIAAAGAIGAEYVVVHAQKPENFGGDNPIGFDEQAALDSALRSCEKLVELSGRHDVPVLVENVFRNSSFFSAKSFRAVFDSFPELGFCLDVGHLDVDCRLYDFDFDEFIDSALPFMKAIHLQNSNPDYPIGGRQQWKIPVHPSHTAKDGWRDIEALLRKVLAANPQCAVNFEMRYGIPEENTIYEEGVDWIKRLIPEILSKNDSVRQA